MKHRFEDITSRIPEPPTWYDMNGTPRYGEFTPYLAPDIYTHSVVLMRIACQECGAEFLVEMHASIFGAFIPMRLHYGDPPRHTENDMTGQQCLAGSTMNCYDLEIVECWHREAARDWARYTMYEGVMDGAQGQWHGLSNPVVQEDEEGFYPDVLS